ncbi:EamA family transporter [Pseudomonas sp. MF6772]|jgi:drug/metabolite transporter (DMT)-like permease|uniref:EamA family transporter n=1 Tax=Pseudomonas shahriarae TaxID=2745512 RepID=A0ABT5NC00_9PSED|nr:MULTISPECIES: EamA family transporter [Pseudomonas]SUD46233.1 4-amino-4-deoxy-L-arabinose-phosphoundecaprenol flippase subunit ArnF [Pseudomonas fluorescens]MBJ2241341.1 EamA family transporter [Pseudomonas sp. MF6768]MBJ2270905.1 EamA family transporter [Pseudomonas sp. MF6772]MBK3439631.1 EamA family transporter [Pseudomonas sp. MF7448]MBL7229076.1 EamA family transporter [Pseudomonas sp.]
MSSQEMAIRPVGWLHGRLGTVVLWALLILTESAGQLFTKVAGDQIGQMDFNWQWLAAVAVNPGILAAIACYIGAFFVWMLILRRSSLSLAFPLSSLVFVVVLLGSWLGLGEHISFLHWVGVVVIIGGIALLAEGEEN